MFTLLLESAIRSLALGAAVWVSLKTCSGKEYARADDSLDPGAGSRDVDAGTDAMAYCDDIRSGRPHGPDAACCCSGRIRS